MHADKRRIKVCATVKPISGCKERRESPQPVGKPKDLEDRQLIKTWGDIESVAAVGKGGEGR